MNNIIKRVTIFSFLFLTACGLKLKVIDGEHFTKQTTLSIGNQDDDIGTVKELKFLLSKEGFNVISPEFASNAVKFKDPFNDFSQNQDLQKAFNVKDLNSIYSIKLNYQYTKVFNRYSYKYFYFSIIDSSGKVIMYGRNNDFSNTYGSDMEYVLKAVAKKLAKQIK